MPDQTTILSLPHILPSQAQKHVTHNEALRLLDVMVQLSVLQRQLNAPPATPALGDRHIVGTAPTGAWAGQAMSIALWNGSAWEFFTSLRGWRAYVVAETAVVIFDGTNWLAPASSPAQFAQLGIGTAADATNKLTVQSAASLFTNPSGSHQLAINKGSAGATGSVLLQQGYQSRAEIGLVASEDLSIKVSPNGTTFFDAITVDRTNGRATLAAPMRLSPAAGDPASLSDGLLWYNSTTGKFRARQLGASVDLIGGPPVFSDSAFGITDDADPTKKAVFQVAPLSTGTTRVYDLPNANGALASLGNIAQTFAAASITFQASDLTLGNAAANATYNLGSGATANLSTKTINIGPNGVTGSTTNIGIGPSGVGAFGTIVNYLPTTFIGPVTMNATSLSGPNVNATLNRLGLGGAAPDATNRLSVNTPAVLFNHAGTSVEANLNKAGTADNARVQFSTGFSVRGQFGLNGNNDVSLRVSADGTSFQDAFSVAAASGQVSLPKPLVLTGQASDPASPADGTAWYNSTTGQLKARLAGEVVSVGGQSETPYLIPVSGEFIATTSSGTGAMTTWVGVAGRIDLFPFIARRETVVTGLSLNCTVAVAAALGKIVVYASDSFGRPSSLILETADLDLATVGVKTATASLTMVPGRTYWLGVRSASTATISAWEVRSTPDINGGTPGTTLRKVLRRTLAYATAAPASWGFLSSEANAQGAPAVWLRV